MAEEIPPENFDDLISRVPQTEVKRPKVMIATPCYGNIVYRNYFNSMIKLAHVAAERKDFDLHIHTLGGESLITRARNRFVADFYANPSYTHLLFIDADVGFETDAAYQVIFSDFDIACGIYPCKSLNFPEIVEGGTREDVSTRYLAYPFNPYADPADESQIQVTNGFAEVHDAPTGFMCIKRSVIERMMTAYPERKYRLDQMPGNERPNPNDRHYNLFDVGIDGSGRYLSEDYYFIRLAQQLGIKAHALVDSKFTHYGSHLFEGDLLGHLTRRFGEAA